MDFAQAAAQQQYGLTAGTEGSAYLMAFRDRAQQQASRLAELVDGVNKLADQLFGSAPQPAPPPMAGPTTIQRDPPLIDSIEQAQYRTNEAIEALTYALQRLSRL